MRHLLAAEGLAALAATLARGPLLAFDFDGTLAPIVPRPQDARLSQEVSARLAALARHLPLAIVTGRSVGDVGPRLGFEPRFVVGNHGAEMDPAGAVPVASPVLSPLRQRLAQAQAALQAAGVTVEDKGLSVALHYRLAPRRGLARRAIAAVLEPLEPELHAFDGKRVVNVVPRQAPDKAAAVLALAQRCRAASVFFAGDDVNDEPVFAAARPGWLTVRVGRDGRRSSAMYFLHDTTEVAQLLDHMARLLGEAGPAGTAARSG